MLIWIFQTGEPLHCDNDDSRPMRAMNLANSLIQKGHTVKIISSRFYHQKKIHRSFSSLIHINKLLSIELIESPGYQKHIGFKRLYDHFVLSHNLKVFLKKECKKPDIIFLGYPPISSAFELSKWAFKNNIPYLTDVKDKWPDNFINAIPDKMKFLGKILLYPLYKKQFYVFKNSKGIISNSEGFLSWCLTTIKRDKNPFDRIVPLSSPQIEQKEHIKVKKLNNKSNINLNICFAGTLANSFDFEPIIGTAIKLKEKNISARITIAGDGPLFTELKDRVRNIESHIILTGWLNKNSVDQLFKDSDLAIAPYIVDENFKTTISNKIIDYLSYGLPILIPNVGEMAWFIKENKVGYIVNNDSEIIEIIKTLIENKSLLKNLKKTSQEIYDTNFKFETVYNGLVSHIENTYINGIS